jgi:hypothetical protein
LAGGGECILRLPLLFRMPDLSPLFGKAKGHFQKSEEKKFEIIKATIEAAVNIIYDWRYENSPDHPDVWLL